MNITVSAHRPPDLEWVSQADRDFPHPWSDDAWHGLSEHMHLFIAKKDECPLGYALFQHIKEDDEAHLLKIFLTPEARGTGAAHQLFENSLRALRAKKVFLEVGESNVAAQKFYAKIGFNRIHLAKGFYSDGENAWLMLLTR